MKKECTNTNTNTTEAAKYKPWKTRNFFITVDAHSLYRMGIISEDYHKKPKLENREHWTDEFLKNCEEQLICILKEDGAEFYGCWAIGATGHIHGHLCITYKSPVSVNHVYKTYGLGGVKATQIVQRGNKEEATDYIEKTPGTKYEEKDEKVLWCYGDKESVQSAQGQRKDLSNFDEEAKKPGFDLTTWLLENIDAENSNKWSYFEKRYAAILRDKARQRTGEGVKVIYVEGEPGSGKSAGVYKRTGGLYEAEEVFKMDQHNKNFPFNGYTGEHVLYIDELRPGQLSPALLFSILDPMGYEMKLNIKNGQSYACWDTVIITTSYKLKDWYKDGEKVKDAEAIELLRLQFLRRIAEHYTTENFKWKKDENFSSFFEEERQKILSKQMKQ